MEKNMVIMFFANMVLFFAGHFNIHIPYLLIKLHMTVLVPSTHSLGERLIVSISMKAKEDDGQSELKWPKLEAFASYTYHSLPQNESCN